MRHFFAVLSFLGMVSATQAFPQNGPVVIELYTSQGCSSCPPADAILHDLAKRDDIIALAMHVDYWDYIGWKDTFASPEITARQHAYARTANATMVYTPQMIVNGVEHVVGSRTMQVMDLVQAHTQRSNPVDVELTRRGNRVLIRAAPATRGDYLVQLVRYIPEQTVSIRRGENAGREISYAHIVTSWDIVGRWDGRSTLALEAQAAGNDAVVAIVQYEGHGAIVGAAELR